MFSPTQIVLPFAAGQSLSAQVPIGGDRIVAGLTVGPSWTAASVTFLSSIDGGSTWLDLWTEAGAALALTVAPSVHVGIDPRYWRSVTHVQARSGTSGTPVIQASAVNLTLLMRPLI